jgi:hypothetical protein
VLNGPGMGKWEWGCKHEISYPNQGNAILIWLDQYGSDLWPHFG